MKTLALALVLGTAAVSASTLQFNHKNAYRFRQTSGWYGGPWYANAQLMQCLK
jgi:hypothetical protein